MFDSHFYTVFFGGVGVDENAGQILDVMVFCNLLCMSDPTVDQVLWEYLAKFRVPARPAILKRLLPKFDTRPIRNLVYPTRQRFLVLPHDCGYFFCLLSQF